MVAIERANDYHSRPGALPQEEPHIGRFPTEPEREVGSQEAVGEMSRAFHGTEDNLDFDGTKLRSTKHLLATVNALLGNFRKASIKALVDAFKANRAQATLSEHSPEALGKMERFQLGDSQIYYALNPIEEHWKTGHRATDITMVMNNSGGEAPGTATPAVLLHAIKTWLERGGHATQGDLTLDAWGRDRIPTKSLWQIRGFGSYARDAYNVAEFGEPTQQLKEAWKQDGWKEGDPFPSVVYMKYEGPNEFRTAQSNYLRRGSVNSEGSGHPEPGGSGELLLSNARTSERKGSGGVQGLSEDGEPSNLRSEPGNQGTPHRPVDSYRQQLRDIQLFSDEELRAVGIDPAILDNVERYGLPLGADPIPTEVKQALQIPKQEVKEGVDAVKKRLENESPEQPEAKASWRESLKSRADDAKERLKKGDYDQPLGSGLGGIDPQKLADLLTVAADYIVDLGGHLVQVAQSLAKDFKIGISEAQEISKRALVSAVTERVRGPLR